MTSEADLWQEALESPRGIRVKLPSGKAAWHKRAWLYNERRKAQRASLKLFAADHPMHGKSFYDNISIQLRSLAGEAVDETYPDETYLVFVKHDAIKLEIEQL